MTHRERARQATREAGTLDWGSDDQEQLELAVEQAITAAVEDADNRDARIAELEEARTADNHWIIDLQEENKKLEADAARFLDILRDVWNQFAIERPDGTKWHGGLSTLEDVAAALRPEQPARSPHTHYCQSHAGLWECKDTKCERADVFGCEQAPTCAEQPAESEGE